jgi:hypothetical protein
LSVIQSASVNGVTGVYNSTFVSGASEDLWGNTTYTVTVVYAASAQSVPITASTTFHIGESCCTTSHVSYTTSLSTSSSNKESSSSTLPSTTTVVLLITNSAITTGPGSLLTSVTTNEVATSSETSITHTTTSLSKTIGPTVRTSSGNAVVIEVLGSIAAIIAVLAGAVLIVAYRVH